MTGRKSEVFKFSDGRRNAKLKKLAAVTGKKVVSFSLLAGKACPAAGICLAWAEWTYDPKRKKLRGRRVVPAGTGHGANGYTCFDAAQEAMYIRTWLQRKHNYELMMRLIQARDVDGVAALLDVGCPQNAEILRWHVAGDVMSPIQLMGMYEFLRMRPWLESYIYTKSLHIFRRTNHQLGAVVPDNIRIVASAGGDRDDLIPLMGYRVARVVHSAEAAEAIGLEVDEDDTHALYGRDDFALIVHGTQAAGSEASAAVTRNKRLLKKAG